jgi:hypothetical protein
MKAVHGGKAKNDRIEGFDETAFGTERFLGRDLRHGCRLLTRQWQRRPDPV